MKLGESVWVVVEYNDITNRECLLGVYVDRETAIKSATYHVGRYKHLVCDIYETKTTNMYSDGAKNISKKIMIMACD